MKKAKDVIKRKARKETVGDIIKRYREAFELSQAALADLIGTSQNNISAIENGKRDIGVNVAIKLLKSQHFPTILMKNGEIKGIKGKHHKLKILYRTLVLLSFYTIRLVWVKVEINPLTPTT